MWSLRFRIALLVTQKTSHTLSCWIFAVLYFDILAGKVKMLPPNTWNPMAIKTKPSYPNPLREISKWKSEISLKQSFRVGLLSFLVDICNFWPRSVTAKTTSWNLTLMSTAHCMHHGSCLRLRTAWPLAHVPPHHFETYKIQLNTTALRSWFAKICWA